MCVVTIPEEKHAFLSPWWARHLGPARAREKSILLQYICGPVIGMKIFLLRTEIRHHPWNL